MKKQDIKKTQDRKTLKISNNTIYQQKYKISRNPRSRKTEDIQNLKNHTHTQNARYLKTQDTKNPRCEKHAR